MIVVSEWGNIGLKGSLDNFFTEFDHELHELAVKHLNSAASRITMGHLIVGRWLGQQVRIILKFMKSEDMIFNDIPDIFDEILLIPDASFLSEIHDAKSDQSKLISIVTRVFNIQDVSEIDLDTVAKVCDAVIFRAATIVSCGIVATVRRMECGDSEIISIGTDGTLFDKHSGYAEYLREITLELFKDSNIKVDFVSTSDGSGTGAALIAALQ